MLASRPIPCQAGEIASLSSSGPHDHADVEGPFVVPRHLIGPSGLGPLFPFPVATMDSGPMNHQQGWNICIFSPENIELHSGGWPLQTAKGSPYSMINGGFCMCCLHPYTS